ncbi:MAG: BtrH N-terminal domain-containing protein [Oceanococcus sp.]
MIEHEIAHRHTGHCETGVTSILLEREGLCVSEALVLGLSSGMTFAHFPFIRINQLPLTTYRMPPQSIFRGLGKRIGVRWQQQRFRDADQGMQALDEALQQGHVVGVQASVYWLPYFPKAMRFHFNAHNLIVYGKDGDDYLISDPVFSEVQRCPAQNLKQARFVRGALAPKGLLYWPQSVPAQIDMARVVPQAIGRTANMMLRTPFPFVGTRAISRLARRIPKVASRNDDAYLRLYLGQIVRMQEEIGTGGGGFRFMYAAFLRESADALDSSDLAAVAEQMTEAGDAWRHFALQCAKQVRSKQALDLTEVSGSLQQVAGLETQAFRDLLTLAKELK